MTERAEAAVDRRMLRFDSDVAVRRRYFTEASFAHPAKMHLGLLAWLVECYTRPGDTIADPMAGSGSILLAATIQRNVIARDVEPRFLALTHDSAARILRTCGLFAGSIDIASADAREPWEYTPDCVIVSPPYGNAAGATPNQRRFLPYAVSRESGLYGDRWLRFASKMKDGGEQGMRGALAFYYGEHPAQVGHLREDAYWEAMEAIYRQTHGALRRGGTLILVVKDHVRHGARVHVADRTEELCEALGFRLQERHSRLVSPLSLWQRRRKERGEPVVEDEDVLVFTREEVSS